MSPRELVHDSALYDKKLKQTRRALRARRQYKPPQPVHPVDSQSSDSSSRAQGFAVKGPLEPSAPLLVPEDHGALEDHLDLNPTLPTPHADLIRDFREVVTRLRLAGKEPFNIPTPLTPPRRVCLPRKCKLSSSYGLSTPEAQPNHHLTDNVPQTQSTDPEDPLDTPQHEALQPPLEQTPPGPDHPVVPRPRAAMASLLCLLAQCAAQVRVPDSNFLYLHSHVFHYLYTYPSDNLTIPPDSSS